ncbi:MAG: hypothetical protein ACETWM_20100 [Candidatus Lokiarchaeia archaeon]
MDVYWLVTNPLMYDLLNILFGILLVVGIGLFIYNLVMLIFSYRRSGPIIGMIISLFIVGISVRWEWIIPIIAETMGGVAQYIGLYLYQIISQWLAQHTATATALLLL